MAELMTSPSLPRSEFVVSLPLSLMSTMSLVCAAPCFEGLDQWLLEARQRLGPDLLAEMALVVGFPGRFQRFTEEVYDLLVDTPELSFEGFVDWLRELPAAEYARLARRALIKDIDPPIEPEALPALLSDPPALAALLQAAEVTVDLDAALALVQEPEQLKPRFVAVVERFWEQVYADEWAARLPVLRRSVTYHRQQLYRHTFPDLFTLVTGRLLPETHADLAPEWVRFVPSCYIGPYFTYMRHIGGITVIYNSRITPAAGRPGARPALFPPLKALADETRLEILELLRGRELYAQQIVDQLDISQAAVSRHLNLMTSAGVLRVRQEGGAKYYSINANALTRLADGLRQFGE